MDLGTEKAVLEKIVKADEVRGMFLLIVVDRYMMLSQHILTFLTLVTF